MWPYSVVSQQVAQVRVRVGFLFTVALVRFEVKVLVCTRVQVILR